MIVHGEILAMTVNLCQPLLDTTEDKQEVLFAIDYDKPSKLISSFAAMAILDWNCYNGQPEINCMN